MTEQTGPTGTASTGDPETDRLLATAQRAGAEERWSDAEGALRAALDLLAAGGGGAAEVRTRLQLAVLQASTGRVDAALGGIEQCVASAEGLGDDALGVEIHGAAANLLLAAGRPGPAVARFRAGLELAAQLSDPRWQVQLRTGLAVALFQSGEPEAAVEVLQENARFARTVPDAVTAGMALETVSEALASVGRTADALDIALEALARFEEGQAGPFVIQASIAVSNLSLVSGEPEKAARYTTQAVTLGRTFGGPSGESSVLLGLAVTAGQRGDRGSAREFLQQGRACLQAAGLPEPPELAGMLDQLADP
ncbi:MAG: hypothetical protein M3Y91_02340 [Actinomycetota bacterium]|nr:hypothetical protein [Actinomycetota bacterium]